MELQRAVDGKALVIGVKDLVSYIARARVPMPKSTREFVERCEAFRQSEERARSVA
jgi:hypothetical protein